MERELNNEIAKFAERERQEAMKAKTDEKNLVCIDPDSYIAKEIKYQTAIEHQILEEIRQQKKMLKDIFALIKSMSQKVPTLNEIRKEYGLKPIEDGDVILKKEECGGNIG